MHFRASGDSPKPKLLLPFNSLPEKSNEAIWLDHPDQRAERKDPNHHFSFVPPVILKRDPISAVVQFFCVLFQMGKMQEHPFQGVPAVFQFKDNRSARCKPSLIVVIVIASGSL